MKMKLFCHFVHHGKFQVGAERHPSDSIEYENKFKYMKRDTF